MGTLIELLMSLQHAEKTHDMFRVINQESTIRANVVIIYNFLDSAFNNLIFVTINDSIQSQILLYKSYSKQIINKYII